MEDNIAIRLKAFISHLGLNDSAFADKCGISRSTLSLILSGRNKKVSDQQLSQIHSAYPELSIVWLLFGEGQMLSEPSGDENVSRSTISKSENIKFETDDRIGFKESTLSDLNSNQNNNNQLKQSQLDLQIKIKNLESKILELQSEPRKVVKITIFYDDSTFDTFTPEKK